MTIQYKGFSLVEDSYGHFEIRDQKDKVVSNASSRGEGYLILRGLANLGEELDVLGQKGSGAKSSN